MSTHEQSSGVPLLTAMDVFISDSNTSLFRVRRGGGPLLAADINQVHISICEIKLPVTTHPQLYATSTIILD